MTYEFIPYNVLTHLILNFPEFPERHTDEQKTKLLNQLKGLAKLIGWKVKDLMGLVRFLLTGCEVGFCLFDTINLLERKERLARLKKVVIF